MNFMTALNNHFNGGTNYSRYVGRSYKYCNEVIKIIDYKNGDFKFDDGLWRRASCFIEDVNNGVYERV